MRQAIVVGLRDLKLSEYIQVFVLRAPGEAKRIFLEGIKNPNTPLGKYPADFTIHELGLFDGETGRITVHDVAVDLTPYSDAEKYVDSEIERVQKENDELRKLVKERAS